MSWVNIFDGTEAQASPTMKSFANGLFNCSIVGANEIKRVADDDLQPQAWLSIVFEMVFFYLALTRREALKELDRDGREKVGRELVDLLIPNAVDFAFEDFAGDGNAALKRNFQKELNARMTEYSRKRFMVPKRAGDPVEDSAIGALAVRVTKLAGRPNDSSILLACNSHIQDSTLLLEMENFAEAAARLA